MNELRLFLRRWPAALLFPLFVLGTFLFAQTEEVPREPLDSRVEPRESLLVSGDVQSRLEPLFKRGAVRVEDAQGAFLCLGTVVDADGFIVAKAGDLAASSNLMARAFGGKAAIARRVGYDAANDILLLKANLPRLQAFSPSTAEPGLGSFVFALDGEKRPTLRGGVVSAASRPVDKREGYMGIRMADRKADESGVRIFDVLVGSGAAEGGLKNGDVLVRVEGEEVHSQEEVRSIVFKHDPGETLKVRIRRGKEELDKEVRLKHASTLNGDLFDRNQLMSGETSKRKTGFTRILQHELTLNRRAMGGPLLDAEGRLVGLNIARVNRVEIYALPWAVVSASVEKLRASNVEAGASFQGR